MATAKKKYSAGEIAMARLFEPKKAEAMVRANTPPVTSAEREAVRARAIAAGKTPTTSGINATVAKNRATAAAAPKKTVPDKGTGPWFPVIDPEAAAKRRGEATSGNLGNPVVLSGPTQAGLDIAAQIAASERKDLRRTPVANTPSGIETPPSIATPPGQAKSKPKAGEWAQNAQGVWFRGASSASSSLGSVKKIGKARGPGTTSAGTHENAVVTGMPKPAAKRKYQRNRTRAAYQEGSNRTNPNRRYGP